MIITCGQCQAKFKVAPEQIKETGSKVRCSNCRHVFTVYRPKAEDAPSPPPADSTFSPRPSRPGGGNFEAADERLDSYLEVDDDTYDSPEEGLTAKERRELRRQLYSDLAGETENRDEDEGDDIYDGLGGDEGELPSLRRSARSRQAEPEDEDYGFSESYDQDEYDQAPADDYEGGEPGEDYEGPYEDGPDEDYGPDDEGYDEYEPGSDYDEPDQGEAYEDDSPSPAFPRRDSLGLSANPVGGAPVIDDADYNPRGFVPGYGTGEPPTVRSAVESPPKRPLRLIIPLALMVLALGAAIYFFSRPGPTALSGGEDPAAGTSGQSEDRSERSQSDPDGTEHIGFTKKGQAHHYRTNSVDGEILIITGTVKNNYPEARSYIRLRGHLLSAEGQTMADRFAYAGNVLSENELLTLPIREISARLNLKGGQDRRNINVPPGGELPFMLVFNNLPEGMASYRIDPQGSEPGEQ